MRLLQEEADQYQDIVILDVSIDGNPLDHVYPLRSLSLCAADGRQYRFRQDVEILRMGR